MEKELFAGIYLITAVVIAFYLFRAMARKDVLGKSMVRVLTAGLIIVLSYIGYLCTNDYFLMSLCNSIQFVAIDWTLFFLAQFVVLFTQSDENRGFKYNFVIGFLVLDNIHLLINPFKEVSMHYEVFQRAGSSYLIFQPQLLFELHLALCYTMVVGVVAALFIKQSKVASIYKVRYNVITAAFMAVILMNVVFLVVKGDIDYSIISYAILGCFLYFYVFDYKGVAVANATKAFFVEQMNNPVVLFDYEGKLLMSNRRAREVLELKQTESLTEFLEKYPYIKLNGEMEQSFETTHVYKDKVIYFQIQCKFLTDKKNRPLGTFFVYDDITEKKRALIQAEYNAEHDILTGTYNRNYFATFKKEIAEKELYPVYGMAYNINGLRGINELHGTEVGDKALRRLAWLLQQFSRVTDYVIRMDGGEMTLILPATSERKATEIFKKIERRVSCFDVEGIQITVEFSSFYMDDINDFDRVYEKARAEIAEKKRMNECKTYVSAVKL